MKEHLFFMAAVAGCVVFVAARNFRGRRNLTTPSGLKVDILQEGNGPVPQKGQTVVVHYTGTLKTARSLIAPGTGGNHSASSLARAKSFVDGTRGSH